MKQILEMPEVVSCDAKGCAYNVELRCHARAITVGDNLDRHMCDTVWTSTGHMHRREGAGVGACRASSCIYNEDLECQADIISVSLKGGEPRCNVFASK